MSKLLRQCKHPQGGIMSDKKKCGRKGCDYHDADIDNGCTCYDSVEGCADFRSLKNKSIDPASRTCNLCAIKERCPTRQNILAALENQSKLGTLYNDFDDIMADLAVICHNFGEES